MFAVEPMLAKAGARVGGYLGSRAMERIQLARLTENARALVPQEALTAFLDGLTPPQASGLARFIASPQFEHLALQVTIWNVAGRRPEKREDLRHSVRLSLGGRTAFAPAQLLLASDLVFQLLEAACTLAGATAGTPGGGLGVAIAADVAAAVVRNNALLARVAAMPAIDAFAADLRTQVAAMRSKLRLTHLSDVPATPLDGLYVAPAFSFGRSETQRTTAETLGRYRRMVVLGDPGAGKSTFAEKLAHDLATDRLEGLEGRVPFLVVAREHTDRIRAAQPLSELLDSVARGPYATPPPAEAVEYLLLNGLAFVIVDGVDETGDIEARRRLGELIEGFAHRYPLCSIAVTSRRVGYSDAPLDPDLFPEVSIAPFSDEQVREYARRWFALEEAATQENQDGNRASFLAESESVSDLRSNPLMLSLLCSVYSSKHYIPRHRTEIYEQCAELLFERWDQRRGIDTPLRYGAHIKPVISRIAWLLFEEPGGTKTISKQRISDFLIEYMLLESTDSRAKAREAAEEFLAFCAGRAWVLTEVGSRPGQPLYGFTHRTFLEYFAATNLVRQGPTPEGVWERLRERLPDSGWRVVALLAVQKLNEWNEGGANEFVRLLLTEAATSAHQLTYLTFAAEVAAQLPLRTAVLARLATDCLRPAAELGIDHRRRYTWDDNETMWPEVDEPLSDLLRSSLPENADRIAEALANALTDPADASESRDFICGFLASWGAEDDQNVRGLLKTALPGRAMASSRSFRETTGPDIDRYGAGSLFKESVLCGMGIRSVATNILAASIGTDGGTSKGPTLHAIYPALIGAPWPWLRSRNDDVSAWVPSDEAGYLIPQLQHAAFLRLGSRERSSAILLLLPFLQHFEKSEGALPGPARPFVALRDAREDVLGRPAAIEQIGSWNLEPEAHELVVRWVRGEASPVGTAG